jgi:anaerobic magnesium-protoporphyrin IX monomethyl ester cyclase
MRVLLVVYDNDSYTHLFPMGLGYIASVLEEHGHDVEVYSQDKYHYPDAHLTQYLDDHHYDIAMVSVIAGYYQYNKLLKISAAINESKNRPTYIIGGYGPTPEPEYFIKKTGADIVAMGEGEHTTVVLMKALDEKTPLSEVSGIAFKDGAKVTINQRSPLIKDLDTISWPAYKKFPIDYYRLEREPRMEKTDFGMPLMSARGCTFKCTFCYRMDTGYRARNPVDLLDEVEYLHKEFGITYVSFQDDLLMSSVEHTENVCREFRRRNLPVKWNCNGRLNYCSVELVKMMKDSGCVFINYGIEAMDNEVLKNMKKGLRTEMVVKGIEMTLEAGISPGLNMMFGNIGDNKRTLKEAVDFLLKYDDFAQMRTIRPVTPYPGSPLYYDAIDKGLIKDVADFYENKHVNSDLLAANFTELSDEEFYESLTEANTKLLTNYYDTAKQEAVKQVTDLYKDRQVGFRGFRQI